jgi:hypothetical protein
MSDFSDMAEIYEEGYRGHSIDLPSKNFRGVPAKIDYKHSFMPTGVANAGGADNAYAANMMATGGVEGEESPQARIKLEEFADELRARGHDQVANELLLVIRQAFESGQ